MSRLKTIINHPFGRKPSLKWEQLFRRTDHVVCKKINDTYHVWCKYVPTFIGHLYTFNADLFTPKKALRIAMRDWKKQNLLDKLKLVSEAHKPKSVFDFNGKIRNTFVSKYLNYKHYEKNCEYSSSGY